MASIPLARDRESVLTSSAHAQRPSLLLFSNSYLRIFPTNALGLAQ